MLTGPRSLALVFVALCALLPKARAAAQAPYELQVEDAWGRPLAAFHHQGEQFVLGVRGRRYTLRVRNRTARRVEAVVTVDGRDVLSGQPGEYAHQRGYVIEPHGSVRIEGFRQSLDAVAAFRFSSPSQSYSARMGSPENVGIIGAAFFPEAPARPARPSIAREPRRRTRQRGTGDRAGLGSGQAKGRSGAEAPAASGMPAEESADAEGHASNLGTQYGESRASHVREVKFRRAHPNSPRYLATVRYDDRRGLEARGILPRRPPAPVPSPRAFPLSRRFAPPPPPLWD